MVNFVRIALSLSSQIEIITEHQFRISFSVCIASNVSLQISEIFYKMLEERLWCSFIIICFINFKIKSMSLRKNINPSRKESTTINQKQPKATIDQTNQ